MLAIFAPSGDAKDTTAWTLSTGFSAAASQMDGNGTWTLTWTNVRTGRTYPWKFASAAFRNAAIVALQHHLANTDASFVVSVAATGVVTIIGST